MFEWTRKYWQIGYSFYKQYPNTLIGSLRAIIMFWALPKCCKIIAEDPSGNLIHVASFAEADRIEKMLEQTGV